VESVEYRGDSGIKGSKMKYIVALEVVNGSATQFIAPWKGDPGRTCIERTARRYGSTSSATYGLAAARKFRDFPDAIILEVTE
jgi:hypothetical protein